jgi:hypothetical protein
LTTLSPKPNCHFGLNSGDDRVLALDRNGHVVLDSGRIDGLDAGGSYFGPDGRYYLTLRRRKTVLALPASLAPPGSPVLRDDVVPSPLVSSRTPS